MITAYISVGSNVEKEKHSKIACSELRQLGHAIEVSPIYECAPVGFEGQTFYNFIVSVQTNLALDTFAERLREIELKWGRSENAQKYQDRTLDLDIVLFGEHISKQSPELPRRDIYQYPFVIKPLYDLQPALVIPDSERTIADIWQSIQPDDSLTQVALELIE